MQANNENENENVLEYFAWHAVKAMLSGLFVPPKAPNLANFDFKHVFKEMKEIEEERAVGINEIKHIYKKPVVHKLPETKTDVYIGEWGF